MTLGFSASLGQKEIKILQVSLAIGLALHEGYGISHASISVEHTPGVKKAPES